MRSWYFFLQVSNTATKRGIIRPYDSENKHLGEQPQSDGWGGWPLAQWSNGDGEGETMIKRFRGVE